ncbi:MAG TPA: AmmeMemoRadiSam system protein A [Burkholderiales bacterium]|nr:AmmeMemoRadiSam system protein A [Burkholderiales bacterium]
MAASLAYPADAGQVLLPLARSAIAAQLGVKGDLTDELQWLKEHGACFITVRRDDKLRGCIGTLRAHRALADDVRANAVAAAFRDPRFAPLNADELSSISLEISLLSALEEMTFSGESDALAQLRAGTDGIVFEYGHHTSTFLPQVWEDIREPAEFLAHLKYKAGLPPDFWDPAVRLSRYTVSKWRENDL